MLPKSRVLGLQAPSSLKSLILQMRETEAQQSVEVLEEILTPGSVIPWDTGQGQS